jgi:ubiquinone/menaquinone biosynthesis C-methylase UbiE
MDSFEMGYNQFNINNYRSTLAKQCEGNVLSYLSKILETCAGSNRNLRFFKPTDTLTLIDWSPYMASIGMTKTVPATNYKYVVGDVTKMPFADN